MPARLKKKTKQKNPKTKPKNPQVNKLSSETIVL